MWWFRKQKKLGLALGGGAARGFAHIGALKVLEERGIRPDFVAGTSVGSLVGALYCAGLTSAEIADQARQIAWRDLVQMTVPSMGLVKGERLESLVDELVEGRTIEDLEIPFAAVAVDIRGGEEVVLESGPISRAVHASCAIPGFFVPVDYDGVLLVDGGIMNGVPADVVKRMGAEYAVGIDLNANDMDPEEEMENVLAVLARTMSIFLRSTNAKGRMAADCWVEPDLSSFSYRDMSHMELMMTRGEAAMRGSLRKLRKVCPRLA